MIRHYSNRPDLLQQLRKVAAILAKDGEAGADVEVTTESVIRSRRLRDRFSREDLQTMIDLYRSGPTAQHVAEKFGVSLRSVKRLLHQHGVRRLGPTATGSDLVIGSSLHGGSTDGLLETS